jgi:glycosyltransferase involved in cell wall biosynthesis
MRGTTKKIICLIPSLSSGGAERQMSYLIQFLNEIEYKPTVITYYQHEDYVKNLDINRIHIIDKYLKRYTQIIKTIKRENPDVILSYTWIPNVLSIITSLFCKNIKIVVSERNTSLRYNLPTRILFNLYRRANMIVVNSNSQTEFIRQNASFLSSKLKTITNYTNISGFSFSMKQKKSVIKIGILARYHPQKNIIRFLKAVKILNQIYPQRIEYYWYGASYGSEYYRNCDNLKKQYALQNVYFGDFSDNVASVMEEIDAVCLPSLYEGFSNTLSEAICAGKPVLASNVCDNPTFVKEGKNGFLFDPYSPTSMAQAFEKLIMLTDEEFIEFQKNSRELATTLFLKEKFIDNYLEILFK